MSAPMPVSTAAAPQPGGHYAQAILSGDLVFVSGQLPIRPDGQVLGEATFEDQVRQAIENLFAIVEASGSSRQRIVKTTVYLVGVERWPAFNEVYATAFGDHRPARSVVPVAALHHGCLVEIEGIAAR